MRRIHLWALPFFLFSVATAAMGQSDVGENIPTKEIFIPRLSSHAKPQNGHYTPAGPSSATVALGKEAQDKILKEQVDKYNALLVLYESDEMRQRQATVLASMSVNVDWHNFSWLEMVDMQKRAGQNLILKSLGVDVDWGKHTLPELEAMEATKRAEIDHAANRPTLSEINAGRLNGGNADQAAAQGDDATSEAPGYPGYTRQPPTRSATAGAYTTSSHPAPDGRAKTQRVSGYVTKTGKVVSSYNRRPRR